MVPSSLPWGAGGNENEFICVEMLGYFETAIKEAYRNCIFPGLGTVGGGETVTGM